MSSLSSLPSPPTLLRRPPVATAITWLLPPALALAAIGVYFGLIAPPQHHPWYAPPPPKPGQSASARAMRKGKGVEADVYYRMHLPQATPRPPSPRAAAAVKGDAAASDDGDDDGRGGEERPAAAEAGRAAEGAGARPDATGSATATAEPGLTARPRATLDALWARHREQPLADEPEDAAWAQAHRSLIYQLAALAREQAFAGAPDPMDANVVDVTCRSVRCAIVLSSRYPHELGLLGDTLGRLRWSRRPLWRHYASEPAVEESDDDGGRRHRATITVAFTADLPPLGALTLDGQPLVRDPTGAPTTAGRPSGAHGPK